MTTMSFVNLGRAPATSRSLKPPAKVNLPEFYAVRAWLYSSNRNAPLTCRIRRKRLSKLNECRVTSLDASEINEENTPCQIGNKANKQIEDSIEYVKNLLTTMGDGRISVSPYDTSIVALIKDLKGRDAPQFPSCLDWIARHQLADGSWGDEFFCIYDRILNTLACVVALKTWNLHHDMIEKGVTYIDENVHKLKDGNVEHMTSGFEIVFPALVERAENLGILPYDHPTINDIANKKEARLKKIPKDLIHQKATSLLYSLEGMGDLEWEKMLKLQFVDGSFLFSPASTACVFMHTNDRKCLKFIEC
ncbi:Gly-Xaa carboxypeptidase [Salvia divinorum]|uniref:Gly-Xaa carboxypeptidase n=1 Tax=Salvia divinorum TaxID=28513 RepID=A0ABD1HC48_SALDI